MYTDWLPCTVVKTEKKRTYARHVFTRSMISVWGKYCIPNIVYRDNCNMVLVKKNVKKNIKNYWFYKKCVYLSCKEPVSESMLTNKICHLNALITISRLYPLCNKIREKNGVSSRFTVHCKDIVFYRCHIRDVISGNWLSKHKSR